MQLEMEFQQKVLSVLIDEDRIAVGVLNDEAAGPFRLRIGFRYKSDAFSPQFLLQIADILERIHFLRVTVPAGIERQHVFFEHALEQSDDAVLVLHDQPILVNVPAECAEGQFLVKCL